MNMKKILLALPAISPRKSWICSAVHAQRNSHGPNIGSGAEPALGHGSQQKELTRQFSSLKKIPKSQSPE